MVTTKSRLPPNVDVIVFDIQDVGARFYTYISTMYYVMEACAENKKEMVVLDRPNPCDYVDGPILKPAYRSFVGMLPLPVLHGCTIGELAQMINGEGWIANKKNPCSLKVIPATGWIHGEPYSLPIKPSPNLPNDQSIRLYASLCPFEATRVSVGRGTTFPFQVLGAPNKKYGDFTFTPRSLPDFDKNPMHKNVVCYGEDLRNADDVNGFTAISCISTVYPAKVPLSSPVPGGLTCSWARIVYAKLSSEAIRKRLSGIVGKRNYRITRRSEKNIFSMSKKTSIILSFIFINHL